MLEKYPDVLNVKEVCTILRISRKTVYALIRKGTISCRRIGRVYKIPKEGIIAYLSEKGIENQSV